MKIVAVFLITILAFLPTWGSEMTRPRPQQYATFRAHTIMPDALHMLVKREAKALFQGLTRGLAQPIANINSESILKETDRITQLLNDQEPFARVVDQMGYVSGLVAVYANPSLDCRPPVRQGFQFYLNAKLDRCLFVFDGFPKTQDGDTTDHQKQWLSSQLGRVTQANQNYHELLESRYRAVQYNPHYIFNEQSAVFGVSSIYFSNMARLTAHLWYYAWISARGDLSGTPYRHIR